MSADVDEEIYEDGTSISNITVSGVKSKIAMFGTQGAKPAVASKPVAPVLARFQQGLQDSGQGSGANFGPRVGGASGGPKPPPAWKKSTETASSNVGKTKEADHNQNKVDMKDSNATKRSSKLNIPNSFMKDSKDSSVAPPFGAKKTSAWTPASPVTNGDVTTPVSPASSTAPPKVPEEDKPPFDFKAGLRKASTGGAPPKPLEINSRQRLPSEDATPPPPNADSDAPVLRPGKSASKTFSTTSSSGGMMPSRVKPVKTVVTRSTDNVKFERVSKASIISYTGAPIKPLKLKGCNVQDIIEAYKTALQEFMYANDELYDDVGNFVLPPEEEYDDVGNLIENSSPRPVSEIPCMTEEDEMVSGGSASTTGSGRVPSEIYDDCVTQGDDVGSDSGSGNMAAAKVAEDKRLEKEQQDRLKREEKERKEQEKRDKADKAKKEKDQKKQQEKEQKEREKKEKELKGIMKKFNMTGAEVKEAEGIVINKHKGGKMDLAVSADERVEIIRMTNNPRGKWLARNAAGNYGYVDSENMQLATDSIKQTFMKNVPEADEELYEALDENL